MTVSVNGGLGVGGLADFDLGGPQVKNAAIYALPAMATKALSYIAHLYDHNMVFKRTLGGASIINKPGLKLTQNGGYQPITLEVAASVTGLVLGDVIRLSEQGDNAGTILFSGNVEETPDELAVGAGATHHLIVVTPWVSELGDGFFNQTYATPTDPAQWVRDAVATTAHCSVSPISCPDTGFKFMYDFQNSNPLDAIHVAKQTAGAQWWWFCDAQGVVWFQPVVTANPPTLTLRKGVDYNSKKPTSTIVGQKNKVVAIGGANPGDPGRIQSVYNGATNQALYGVRAMNPTLAYPTVTDQATLDAIVASLGAQFDRVLNTVELTCPALGKRLSPARAGGLTVRFWEPNKESLQETGLGSGGYSPTFILQDVQVDGPGQTLIVGDIPYADIDTAYEAARVAQRTAVIAATAIPIPPLAAQPAPATTSVIAKVNATTGIYAAGGGLVTVATKTFTTTLAGVCQVIGALDARMEAWNNYVATPRRSVRAVLSGGIFTGAWQELPFGLARATYDLSSASGLAIPAGTYTVSIQIDTEATNQMHIYSGYVQVVWTG